MSSALALELKNLGKSFKKDVVIDDVSLGVQKGETLVIFGPSGAGKTVLLRLIAGVIEPDHGSIHIDGQDVADIESEDRGIGMAFQNFALFPHMSAFDNIASPLTAKRMDTSAIRAGVESVAKLLKIDHVLAQAPRELSNGQKQRTALARALAGQPALLLLDDPLRNVDAKLRFEMRLELPRLLESQGATVIYVTQDYKEAMALGQRIAVMDAHGIRQLGTPTDIYDTPASIEIARLFGDPVINLLDVTPEQEDEVVQVRVSDSPQPIDAGFATAIGKPCVLGVRPEAFRFVAADHPGAIPVEVEAETPLNEKIVSLMLTHGQREILISRPAGTPGPASGAAHVAVKASQVMLFDRDSRQRIDVHGQTVANRGAAA